MTLLSCYPYNTQIAMHWSDVQYKTIPSSLIKEYQVREQQEEDSTAASFSSGCEFTCMSPLMGIMGTMGYSCLTCPVTDSNFHILTLVQTMSSVAPTIAFLLSVAFPLMAEIFTRYTVLPFILVDKASLSPSVKKISFVFESCDIYIY